MHDLTDRLDLALDSRQPLIDDDPKHEGAFRLFNGFYEGWRDLAIDNRAALLEVCAAFENSFRELRERIDAADGDALGDMFERAKRARDQHYAAQSNSED